MSRSLDKYADMMRVEDRGSAGEVTTPVDLAIAMLDQIPEAYFTSNTTTFLDPCFGNGTFIIELIKKLRSYGHSMENIQKRVYGCEISKRLFNKVKKRLAKYDFDGIILGDSLEREWNMKFDVYITNPPYGDPNNNKSMLWNKFTDLAMNLTEEGGDIVMVTPNTWLRGTTNIHNSYKLFEERQVEDAFVFLPGDGPFPANVGTTASYYRVRNIKKVSPTNVFLSSWSVRSNEFVRQIDIATEKVWPGTLTQINLNIHDKLQTHSKIEFVKSCEFHNQKLKTKGLVSDVQTDEFPYTHHVSAKITRYTSVKFSKHSAWKVMVPTTSSIHMAVADNNCGHGEDMYTLYFDTEKQALNAQATFRTNTFKYIGKMYKQGRNQLLQGIFPQLAFDKPWTDEELFKHFKFNQEEIATINS